MMSDMANEAQRNKASPSVAKYPCDIIANIELPILQKLSEGESYQTISKCKLSSVDLGSIRNAILVNRVIYIVHS